MNNILIFLLGGLCGFTSSILMFAVYATILKDLVDENTKE